MGFISRLFGKDKCKEGSFIYQILEGFDECAQCHRKIGPGIGCCPHCGSDSILSTEPHLTMRKTGKNLVDTASQLWRKGDRSKAIVKMREAICVNPWNAVAHGNVGFFYTQLGKKEDDQFYTVEYLDRALLLGHPTPEPVRELLNQLNSRNPVASALFNLTGFFVFEQETLAQTACAAFPTRICNVDKIPFVYRPLRDPSPLDPINAMSAIRESIRKLHPNAVTLEVCTSMSSSGIWYTLLHMRAGGSSFEVITSDIESKRFNTLRDVLLSERGGGYIEVSKK